MRLGRSLRVPESQDSNIKDYNNIWTAQFPVHVAHNPPVETPKNAEPNKYLSGHITERLKHTYKEGRKEYTD